MIAYRDRRVVITGARGYLGTALARALNDAGCEPTLLDRAHGDFLRREPWQRVVSDADCIFHLAALYQRRAFDTDPLDDLAANAGSVLQLLETCRTLGRRPRIVFASSAILAGMGTRSPVSEEAADDPLTLYAVHKLTAERYLKLYARTCGIPSVSLRLSNVYGPVAGAPNSTRIFLNRLVEVALAGGPLTVYRNRDCLRDFVHVDDVVGAFLAAGACALEGAVHAYVGSGCGHSIGEAVHLVADAAARRLARPVEVLTDDAIDVEPIEWRNFVADTARFRALTGWQPAVAFPSGVQRAVDTTFREAGRP